MADGKSAAAPLPRSQHGRAGAQEKCRQRARRRASRAGLPRKTGRLAWLRRPFCGAKRPVWPGRPAHGATPWQPAGCTGTAGWRNKLTKTAMPRRHGHKKEVRRDTSMDIAADSTGFIPAGNPHSGMLPCFLGGLLWFLLRHISRAHISLRRVSRGMMTSSMSPRSAVRYGLENSSS